MQELQLVARLRRTHVWLGLDNLKSSNAPLRLDEWWAKRAFFRSRPDYGRSSALGRELVLQLRRGELWRGFVCPRAFEGGRRDNPEAVAPAHTHHGRYRA